MTAEELAQVLWDAATEYDDPGFIRNDGWVVRFDGDLNFKQLAEAVLRAQEEKK